MVEEVTDKLWSLASPSSRLNKLQCFIAEDSGVWRGFSLCWLRSTSFTHVYALSFLYAPIPSFNVPVDDLLIWFGAYFWRLISGENSSADFIRKLRKINSTIIRFVSPNICCNLVIVWGALLMRSRGNIELPILFNRLQYIFFIKPHRWMKWVAASAFCGDWNAVEYWVPATMLMYQQCRLLRYIWPLSWVFFTHAYTHSVWLPCSHTLIRMQYIQNV